MRKIFPFIILLTSLLLTGAGCEGNKMAAKEVGQPRVVQEVRVSPEARKCSGEATTVAMNTAVIPEDPSGSSDVLSGLMAECQTAITQKPAYHLFKFSQGPDSAEAGQELQAGLNDTFYLLGACKQYGFDWSVVAQRTEPRARFECRVNCALDQAVGKVVCESTAYKGLQYVSPPKAQKK